MRVSGERCWTRSWSTRRLSESAFAGLETLSRGAARLPCRQQLMTGPDSIASPCCVPLCERYEIFTPRRFATGEQRAFRPSERRSRESTTTYFSARGITCAGTGQSPTNPLRRAMTGLARTEQFCKEALGPDLFRPPETSVLTAAITSIVTPPGDPNRQTD